MQNSSRLAEKVQTGECTEYLCPSIMTVLSEDVTQCQEAGCVWGHVSYSSVIDRGEGEEYSPRPVRGVSLLSPPLPAEPRPSSSVHRALRS